MLIFSFEDYREFLRAYIESLPKRGWGFARKASEAMGLQAAHFSLALSGEKDFTLEQVLKLGEFLNFNELESEYLVEMVQFSRAGTAKLKEHFLNRIRRLQKLGLKVENHMVDKKAMSPEEKMEFYSNYLYSAIRIFSSLGDGKTFNEIENYFHVPPLFLKNILEFLVSHDLCFQKGDRYFVGSQKTWAEKGTSFYFKHSTNWRLQGIQKLELNRKNDLFVTSPMSISIEDAKIIREQIVSFVREFSDRVKKSEAQELLCLNIDFFYF